MSVLVPRTAPHTPRGSAGRCRFLAGALTCLAMMLAGPTVAGASAEPAPPPVRILIVGDSVTQGSAGDWTWRYRLWEHLTDAGADVDFVGPRNDLLDRNANTYGSHGYLDPGFDQDHAALWGNALGMPAFSISQLVADHQPDVVVELLGVNDLNGLGASVATVDDELGDFVADARAQNPDVAVVLGALGSDWISKVPEFNAQLPGLAHSLDTPTSRVVAAAPPHLVQGVDTYEFVHPSATGEVKIAADVADALSTLGVGPPAARPLPVVPNGPPAPASLTATAGETSASLSWTPPLGADRVYVEQRDLDAADPSWERATDPVVLPEVGTDLCCLVPGDRYRFRLRAAKGTAVAEDIASNVVGLRPGVPSAVRSLRASPRHHGFLATWSAATLATWYQVRWWPAGHPHQWTQERTSRLGLTVHHQKAAGRTYVVSVLGEHNGFLGPATRTEVVPKG